MRRLFMPLSALFVLALAGCGSNAATTSDSPGGTTAKNSAAADYSKLVVGTYKMDANSAKVVSGDPKKQPDIDKALPQMKETWSKSTITFNADGTFTATNPASTGKYTVTGNKVTTDKDAQSGAAAPTMTISPDGKTIATHMKLDSANLTIDINLVKS